MFNLLKNRLLLLIAASLMVLSTTVFADAYKNTTEMQNYIMHFPSNYSAYKAELHIQLPSSTKYSKGFITDPMTMTTRQNLADAANGIPLTKDKMFITFPLSFEVENSNEIISRSIAQMYSVSITKLIKTNDLESKNAVQAEISKLNGTIVSEDSNSLTYTIPTIFYGSKGTDVVKVIFADDVKLTIIGSHRTYANKSDDDALNTMKQVFERVKIID